MTINLLGEAGKSYKHTLPAAQTPLQCITAGARFFLASPNVFSVSSVII